MHPYALLVAAACLTSAACAGFTAARAAQRPTARLVAAIFLGTAWWALCNVASSLVTSREAAVLWMRASAPGWIFLGPLVLHFFAELVGDQSRRTQRLIRIFYVADAGFLVLDFFGSAIVADVAPTPWGFRLVPGPALPAFYAGTMASAAAASMLLVRRLREAGSASERRQRPWVIASVAAPVCVASLTDALFPLMGISFPHLGSASFACLGGIGVWLLHRYGHSVLVPGSLAEEILGALPDGVALVDGERRIRRANPALLRLSERSREELEGLRLEALFEAPVPALGGPCEATARLLRPLAASIRVGVGASKLRDRRGNDLGRVVVLRDLSEVDAMRESMVTTARMAAVGELAAGIAHEINNPIAFVRSNLSQLRGHWKALRCELEGMEEKRALRDLVTDGDALIEESLEGVDRAAEIVRGVRGFSHAGSGERVPTDLNALLDEVLRMLGPRLRGRVTLECHYVDLPRVSCSPQELKQVFLNLLVNAEQAVADGGRIRVSTSRGRDFIGVLVEDDGCGIAPELLERVFDPFFTTKPVGVGTGLGLGIAYQIVKGHAGEIGIESRPGAGTRVRVRLPADAD